MIDVHQDSNVGGVRSLSIIADTDFDANNEPILGALIEDLLFAHRTCELNIDSKASQFGLLYTAEVSLLLPKISATVRDFIAKNGERNWVLILEDFNGYTHTIGSKDAGVNFFIRQTTGGGKNATSFIFQAQSDGPFDISNENINDMWWFQNRVKIESINIIGKKDGDVISHRMNGRIYIDVYIDGNEEVIPNPGFGAEYATDGTFVFRTNLAAENINDTFNGYLICYRYA
jgi:hypothetical protein